MQLARGRRGGDVPEVLGEVMEPMDKHDWGRVVHLLLSRDGLVHLASAWGAYYEPRCLRGWSIRNGIEVDEAVTCLTCLAR